MIEGALWVLFIAACLLVCAVILLQEGKGGGLGDAFGGAGAQTFGHKADGIAKFTGYLAIGIVVLAIVITKLRSGGSAFEGSFAPETDFGLPGITEPISDADAGSSDLPGGESAPADDDGN